MTVKGFDYFQDGRFAYQTISEEYVKRSHSGQIIMSHEDGHISGNKNGIIVSKTKEIEDKIEDINQLKYDVDEQNDVVTNLIEDYRLFADYKYVEMLEDHYEMYEYGKSLYTQAVYLKTTYDAMQDTIRSIREYINNLRRANEYHDSLLRSLESEHQNIKGEIRGLDAYITNEMTRATNSITHYKLKYQNKISRYDLT